MSTKSNLRRIQIMEDAETATAFLAGCSEARQHGSVEEARAFKAKINEASERVEKKRKIDRRNRLSSQNKRANLLMDAPTFSSLDMSIHRLPSSILDPEMMDSITAKLQVVVPPSCKFLERLSVGRYWYCKDLHVEKLVVPEAGARLARGSANPAEFVEVEKIGRVCLRHLLRW